MAPPPPPGGVNPPGSTPTPVPLIAGLVDELFEVHQHLERIEYIACVTTGREKKNPRTFIKGPGIPFFILRHA